MVTAEQHSFYIGTRVDYGVGVHEKVGDVVRGLGGRRVLLVTDANLTKIGLASKVARVLEGQDIGVEVFDGITSEPTDVNVKDGAALLTKTAADAIVAVGGGSVMDCAKCIGVMGSNSGTINDYEGASSRFKQDSTRPLVTLPTTSGTGAEVAAWAVITDTSRSYKMSVGSRYLQPDHALVDPVLTLDLPPRPTAESGFDALSQSIEALMSLRRSPIAEELGLMAVRLISENLPTAVVRGWDLEARANMALGSLLGGVVMTLAGCVAVHSLAETLGGKYHVPHGLTVALSLPLVLEHNFAGDIPLFARVAKALGVETSGLSTREAAGTVVPRIRQMLNDLEFPTLAELGLRSEDIPELACLAQVNPSTPDNPRPLKVQDFETMLRRGLAT